VDFDLLNHKSGIEKALSCKVTKKWVLTVSWLKKIILSIQEKNRPLTEISVNLGLIFITTKFLVLKLCI
jgi:hypothetical protein